jgi:hypothetical protein
MQLAVDTPKINVDNNAQSIRINLNTGRRHRKFKGTGEANDRRKKC